MMVTRTVVAASAAAAICALWLPSTVASGAQSAGSLARHASDYVKSLDAALVAIVGEERYEQRSEERSGEKARRVVRSHIGWVHLARVKDTVAVREVLEAESGTASVRRSGPASASVRRSGPASSSVPADPTSDTPAARPSRLRELLTAPAGRIESNVRALLDESAAHNLVPGTRNINFPTFSLAYLRPDHVDRSRWKAEKREGPLVILSFEERRRPVLVRSETGYPLWGRGRLWIDLDTGRVERSEVRLTGRERVVAAAPIPGRPAEGDVRRTVMVEFSYEQHVTFARDPRLDVWLPERMTDVYERSGGPDYLRVKGEATYSGYRRFETRGRVVTGAR
jgi:hypothetical protein